MSEIANRVILVEPEIPENVGFSVRAMSCFGWTELALVGPVPDSDSPAYRTATMGKEILVAARSHPDLRSAFGAARTTIAFTRRPHRKGLIDVQRLAQMQLDRPLALVFGRESIGLTSDEVLSCDYACRIPTVHETGSLNLGQAVAVALASLHELPPPPPSDSGPGPAVATLREQWTESILLRAESHLHPARREAGRRHLSALLRRLRPSGEELRFLGALLERMNREPQDRANR